MKIKELEEMLSLSRSNIRFYEKQGLFCPQRQDNNYRDYTEEDVLVLKRIIVLRKMGLTVEEIKSVQNNELSFSEAIRNAKQRLEEEIEQLNGSLKLVKLVSQQSTSFEEMDINKQWDTINNSEKAGEKFIDICKDYLNFELLLFDTMCKYVYFHDFKKSRTKHGTIVACVILLLLCAARGIASVIKKESFWSGFLQPFIVALAASLIFLPLYLLSKKAPKVAAVIANTLVWLGILFFASLFIFLIYLVIT